MSYNEVKKDFVKEKFWIIEIDLDFCDHTYGIIPCTAQVGVTGDQKCFNTARTCQDRANYLKSPKTYRFCTKRSPMPTGLDAIPTLMAAPTINGAKIDSSGGLGVRGGISMNFIDHPFSDVGIDKYVNERTYIPYETGTYWGKLRARNPFYNNRTIRAFSGYLVDGVYDPANFQQRTYVIENITANRGVGTVKGKDVLKLADNDRAQYPAQSTGELTSDIDDVVTSFTLTPTGVGNLEYDTSGWVRISDEVMSFTRVADVFTIVRAQYNTLAASHSTSDTVQQCAYLNDTVANIDYELLTVGAKIDPSFIDLPVWEVENDDNFPSFLETLITEPTGVKKLLKELGDNAPHFLYFDEITQLIIFTAVKQPPVNVNTINDQEHIKSDSLKVADKPDQRISDVVVYFGQLDPTKKMDEINNYAQKYVRSDLVSSGEDEFGSQKIKTIFSRWINNFNKAQAIDLSERKGRRFGITPRQVDFDLFSKDSDFRLGDNLGIDHPVLQLPTGETGDNIFQIVSVKEAGDFKYTALEYLYAEALPQDNEPNVDSVIIGGNENNINLRTIYDNLFPSPDGTTKVKFIIDNVVIIGSSSVLTYAVDTGSWPVGAEVTLQTNSSSFTVGKGGNGGGGVGEVGGPAILLNHDLILFNNGIIGGGGGAGGGGVDAEGAAGGGGGAGLDTGIGGVSFYVFGSSVNGGNGTITTGGAEGSTGADADAAAGGDLGENGFDSADSLGGIAGLAIDKNGHVLTVESGLSNIFGVII